MKATSNSCPLKGYYISRTKNKNRDVDNYKSIFKGILKNCSAECNHINDTEYTG